MSKPTPADVLARLSKEDLFHELARCQAKITAYRSWIRDGSLSIERVDSYAREIAYWVDEACAIADELRSRGVDPGWEL